MTVNNSFRHSGRFIKRLAVILSMSLLSAFAQAQSPDSGPNSVIDSAVDEIAVQIAGRKNDLAADTDSLYAMIDGILLPRFDKRYAAQLVLGKHWRTASDEQKADFIAAFYQSLLRKYAEGILEFDENKISVLPYRGDETKSRTVVKTEVRLEDGTKVPVHYGLVKRDAGWLIFDVIIEGISYVRNFRVELNSEIQSSSLDAVIRHLQREAEGADSV